MMPALVIVGDTYADKQARLERHVFSVGREEAEAFRASRAAAEDMPRVNRELLDALVLSADENRMLTALLLWHIASVARLERENDDLGMAVDLAHAQIRHAQATACIP